VKKVFFLIVFLVVGLFCGNADDLTQDQVVVIQKVKNSEKSSHHSVGFKFIGDFNGYPYSYESVYNNHSSGLNGRVAFGVKYREFAWTLSMYEHYFSIGIVNYTDSNLYGAQNIFRWTFDFYYQPLTWFEFEAGIGASLLSSSVVYNKFDNILANDAGLSFVLNNKFILPIKYLDLQIINRLDIFINTRNVSPQYYGGVRAITHPYLQWIDLYLETGVYPYHFESDAVTFTSPIFYFGVGVEISIESKKVADEFETIKLKFVKNRSQNINDSTTDIVRNVKPLNENDIINKIDETIKKCVNKIDEDLDEIVDLVEENDGIEDVEKIEDVDEAKVVDEDEELDNTKNPKEKEVEERYLDNKGSDTINFDNIIFYANMDKIKKEFYPILDKIVEKLISEKNTFVKIDGYTNSTGKPKEELELSLKRALKVAEYLNKKNIGYERIRVSGNGGIVLDKNSNAESNRKVEIKILKIVE